MQDRIKNDSERRKSAYNRPTSLARKLQVLPVSRRLDYDHSDSQHTNTATSAHSEALPDGTFHRVSHLPASTENGGCRRPDQRRCDGVDRSDRSVRYVEISTFRDLRQTSNSRVGGGRAPRSRLGPPLRASEGGSPGEDPCISESGPGTKPNSSGDGYSPQREPRKIRRNGGGFRNSVPIIPGCPSRNRQPDPLSGAGRWETRSHEEMAEGGAKIGNDQRDPTTARARKNSDCAILSPRAFAQGGRRSIECNRIASLPALLSRRQASANSAEELHELNERNRATNPTSILFVQSAADEADPMESNELNEAGNPREAWIRELRKKYLDGSLENILIPENPKLDRLMEDLFPEPVDNSPAIKPGPKSAD